jgi:hypothetical protein
MKFDINAARSSGYSDEEIADYLATENKFDLSGALQSGYSASEVIGFLSGGEAPAPAAAPVIDTGDETARLAARYKAPPQPGIIQRVGESLRPKFKSVMEDYVPTAEEKQADIDRRLSYGAGPISSQAQSAADSVRSSRGQMVSKDPTVNKVVKAMDARGDKSFADLADAAKKPENIRAARDAKAEEFRSAGEWAADTLSNLSQGAVGLVQLPINIIAPSSDIAASLSATQKELQAQESGVLKAQREQLRERVLNEDGFLDKYAATVVQLVTSPALGLSEAVKQVPNFLGVVGASRFVGAATAGSVGLAGRASPTVALAEAISGGAIQAGARVAGTTAGGVGASMVMAGGDAAGGVYEKLTDPKQTPLSVWQQNPDYQKLTAEGKSSKDAIEEIATTKARMAALITAPLGLLGFMGAEAAIASRGLGKATAEALTFAGAGKMLAKDLVGEQFEEGGTQFGGNVISRTVDPNQKLTEGVPEAMATALVTSAPFSAAGAASQFQEARAAQTPGIAAERQAVALFDVNNYDPTLIDPRLTSRQQGDTGPAAPINFTPAGSPTQQAGLVDIVVPTAPETTDVSATSIPPLAAAGSGELASDQRGGGLDIPGLDVNDATGQRGGVAGLAGTNVPQAVSVPGAAGQPTAGLNRPFDRATDQDLLARTEASIASQENNNAVVQPAEQWFGRKGDGYVTQGDAQQALPGRQRMFPDLGWKVESMANGKFRLAGYSETQENVSGTQAPQAIQGQAQGQEAPAAGATAAVGTAAPTNVQGAVPAGLKLALPAPIGAIKSVRAALQAETGLDVAPVSVSQMNDGQKLASTVARLLGKTLTVITRVSGPEMSMPNGLINRAGGKHIMIADDTVDAPLFVTMHEAYHGLSDDKRATLNTALRQLFREDKTNEFKQVFDYTDAQLDEEIPAFMVQAISKRADFWEELRAKMGNAEFAEVAKAILSKLNQILTGARSEYGDEFVNTYITDVAKARDLLTTAYAEAMQEQGLTPDAAVTGDVMMARRAKTEKFGDYEVATAKDGSLTVFGDSDAIRAAMPEGTVGRVTKEGVVFTNAAAPRVRAALEGRNIAYSRGGQVTEKLPMKDGKYLGAPEKFNTPGKIPTLRKILRQLADEGAPGRYWYENSSREVLKMVGGDVNEARKFVALLAIYSPQAKVDANSTFALRAWAQYKAGQPISVKTGDMDKKAKNALDDVDAFWSGEKTGNFFFNLLREIDPSTAGKQGATIDMWMMRAGQYETDAPTATQYSFMENETNRLAQELGWEPQQVQAAIWVAMKARMENKGVKKETERTSEKKGWIKFVPGKGGKGKERVIIDKQKHRDNWLKYSFAHDVTKDDTQQAKFDFGDGLKRHIGQVSFEARPGRTTGVLPGIHDAPYAQQVEFQQAVQRAFLDEQGNDLLAMRLGLLVDNDILAPGVWQGEISPSTQLGVAMAPAKGDAGKTNVDPAQAKALNVYAAVAGLVARQEGVGWHRPFYSSTKRDANGLDIKVGRPLNPREVADLEAAVGQWMADNGHEGWQDQFAFISSPSGIRLVNFGIITNEKLHADILRVAESVLPDADAQWFASSGDMMTNNWKENQNGQDYVARASAEGRSDVLDWARAYLAPRVQRVFDDFSERYDWGDAGKIQFSNRAARPAEPAGRSSAGGDQGDAIKVAGAVHYGKQGGLSVLSGVSFGSGIKGAEQSRLAQPSVDARIKRRVYFYLPVAGGIPQPELGLGGHVYNADLSNLYDPAAGSRTFPATPNEFESAILDAGFRGYVNREQGTAVVLNSDVPVKYQGTTSSQTIVPRKIERAVAVNRTRTAGDELVRRPEGNEMVSIIKARPALAEVAPSFRLEFGEARVKASEAEVADQALADAGSSFQFGRVMASNRPDIRRSTDRTWRGDGYRALNYNPPKNATVADVVRYESEELGNKDIGELASESAGKLSVDLASIPASDAIWVTRTVEQAMEYGDRSDIKKYSVDGWLILADLGDEGALLLNPKHAQGAFDATNPDIRRSNRSIGAALQARIDEDFDGALAEYSGLKGSDGGRLLDTDLVRELSPEYRQNRSRAPEVHEAASDMTQRMFESRLETQPQGTVAFMAGGGGAGKSSAQELLKSKLDKAHTILDGTLSSYDKARRNVQMALDSGNRVLIAYIYREPVEALRNGVLTRAMSKGRTVTIDALTKGHAGSSEAVRKLQDEFGDNPRFRLFAIDNSKGAGNAQIVPLANITSVIKSGLKERLQDATEQEFKAGRISEQVYRSTIKGYADQGGRAEAGPRVQEDVQGGRGGLQGRGGSVEEGNAVVRSNRRQKLIGSNFDVDATSNVDAARIKLQDDALRMKRVIEAVKAKGGTVGEAQNFYDANTLMPGRIQAAIDDFKNDIVKPMLDKAAEYGIDMDELSMYSYAKHAKERNAYIASINKRMPDGGSGMTNDEADNILQMVDLAGDTAKFEELHQALMGITSATRQVMLSEGLITPDEFTALEGAYDNYIPLRGFENVDADTGVARPGVGRGVNVRGAETVRAMGRKSKAGDLIENVIRDYERVIGRVEKNDVAKVLLDFVLSNPDPDLWGVDVERSKPAFNKAQGTVQYTKSIEKGEDTIGVKVGGQQVYIKFADKELTRALRQAWKDETSGLERATLAMTGWWNNWMRAVLTKYNPAFAAINIPRDALWSGTASALAELGPKGLATYLASYPKAFMASARREAGVSGTSNKLFGNPQMDARFAEFRSAGGITGGFFMRSLDDINQDLRNELLLAGAAARNPWEAVKSLPPFKLAKLTLRVLEFMGSASENATRFALYQASREQGNSPAKAAILAKDGTTNFNRKGEWGGALNNLYLFFNAAVQGNAQLFKVLKSPAVQASMAGVTGVGMMLALYGASAGGEDDDGEAYWDKIPSYVKERNIVIMLPPGDALAGGIDRVGKRGRYVTIPVQYGFNMFPNAGYVMADVLRNAKDPKRGMTPTKAALHMTSTVLGSINPFGGAVDVSDGVQVLLAAMPTLVDLPVQIITERGTFGTPSSPQKSPFDKRPDSERMFTSQQDSVSAKIAKALNELGGGNEAKAGEIMGVETSVAPGTIQTLISATTGGLGTFVEQVGTAVVAMTGDGNDLKANKIPFLNKFYGEVDEGANIKAAGDRMREVKALSDEVKAQQKLGLDPELKDKEERLMRLAGMQEIYQKQSTMIRKREIEIIKDKDMTDAEKKLQRKQLQVERDKLSTDMNREYLRVVPK